MLRDWLELFFIKSHQSRFFPQTLIDNWHSFNIYHISILRCYLYNTHSEKNVRSYYEKNACTAESLSTTVRIRMDIRFCALTES